MAEEYQNAAGKHAANHNAGGSDPITGLVTNGDSHDHVSGDGAAITEAALSLSNNTTANTSAAKHGLCPKLSGVATDVLHGDGTWAAAGGGVGMTIEQLTGSGNWTVPDDVYIVWVTGSGPGGGGGGGAGGNISVAQAAGGGGGAGGTCQEVACAVIPGDTISYVCGTGGTGGTGGAAGASGVNGAYGSGPSRFGNYISLGAGYGGVKATYSLSTPSRGSGGAAGSNMYGQAGGGAMTAPSAYEINSIPGSGGGNGGVPATVGENGAQPKICLSALDNYGTSPGANAGGGGGGGGANVFHRGGAGGAAAANAAGGNGVAGVYGSGGGGGAGAGKTSTGTGGTGGTGGDGFFTLRY